MSRILKAALNGRWAMEEQSLRKLLSIAARQNPSWESVQKQLGRELNNTREVTMREGIAVVPVAGPIFRYANFFTRISGASSIEDIATDFTTAVEAAGVHGIILEIDSPGGEVTGVADLARLIYDARGSKPIVAFVDGDGASAAYWLASAADEVVVADTAIVGSIGVRATFQDFSEAERMAGIETIEIISSQSPKKNIDPTTDDGRADIQALLDELADVFIDAVARNRGVSRETVLSDFGQGGVFIGQSAVDAGLADRVSTFEALLDEITERPTGRSISIAPAAGGANPSTETLMKKNQETPAAETPQPEINAEYLAEHHADLVASFRTEGATAERERIVAILELNPAAEDAALVRELAGDPSVDAGGAAIRLRAAESARRVGALREDEAELDAPPPNAASGDEVSNLVNAILTAGTEAQA